MIDKIDKEINKLEKHISHNQRLETKSPRTPESNSKDPLSDANTFYLLIFLLYLINKYNIYLSFHLIVIFIFIYLLFCIYFHYLFIFPTCQVRVVRFYVSCLVLLLLLSSPPPLVVLLVLLLNCDSRSTVFSVGPQPRPSTPSVPCRTSTTTIHAQCSLPDLNHDHPRPVFPAGPQPRVSTPKRYAT